MESSGRKEEREGSGLKALSAKGIPTWEHPEGLLREALAGLRSTEMSHPSPGCNPSHCTLIPTTPSHAVYSIIVDSE